MKHGPKFLKELRENGGFVGKACEASAISKQTVYNWREADSEFAAEWDGAVDLATEDLEKEVRRRALQGIDEPVFYKGEVVGQIRKYSDTLLMFAIKSRKPEYRDTIKVSITPDAADELINKSGAPLPERFGGEPVVDSEM